jgi:uncharacterized protein YjiS (DUF1127 family)
MNQATTYQNPVAAFSRLEIFNPFARLLKTIDTWNQRLKSRSQLAMADGRFLKDVGISEADRFIEVNKPFSEK